MNYCKLSFISIFIFHFSNGRKDHFFSNIKSQEEVIQIYFTQNIQ